MSFETKDSGERAEFTSGMVRDTQTGKARFDLLIAAGVPYEAQFLTRFAELMARGAEKYADRNWEQANSQEEIDRMKSSALRHLMQWASGDRSEDHAAAVCFNLLAAETTRYKIDRAERVEIMHSMCDVTDPCPDEPKRTDPLDGILVRRVFDDGTLTYNIWTETSPGSDYFLSTSPHTSIPTSLADLRRVYPTLTEKEGLL